MPTDNTQIDNQINRQELLVELKDVYHYLYHGDHTSMGLEELDSLPFDRLIRLREWIDFIDANFPGYPCCFNSSSGYIPGYTLNYSEVILDLFIAITDKDLFYKQTSTEFELSKSFLLQYWALTNQIEEFIVPSRIILTLALIYAKHKGVVRCQLKDVVEYLYDDQLDGGYIEFFNKMFAEHPVPYFFLDCIDKLTCVDVDCLMFASAGNDIRQFDRLPYPISLEESMHISHLTKNFYFYDDILKRIVVYVKLDINKVCSADFLDIFLGYCNNVAISIDALYSNIDFWRSVLNFMSTNKSKIEEDEHEPLIEYFHHISLHTQETYSLQNRTYESVSLDRLIYENESPDEMEDDSLLDVQESMLNNVNNSQISLYERSPFDETIFFYSFSDNFVHILKHIYSVDSLPEKLSELNNLPTEHQNRLASWVNFVNTTIQNNYSSFYYEMITLVLDALKSNDLFVEQTPYEFETSKYFLLQFWQLIQQRDSRGINLKSLLKLALIYGKYPGLVQCSIKDAIECFYQEKPFDPAVEFFKTMFVRYPVPPIFLHNFNNLTGSEIDCLMFMISGRNIRHFDKLPYSISRKESFVISQLPMNIDLNNQVLKKVIVYAKLKIVFSGSDLIFNNFISICNKSTIPIDDFSVNLNLWKSVLIFFSNNAHKLEFQHFFLFMDHFIYLAQNTPECIRLKGRTYESVARELNDWHQNADFKEMEVDMETTWLDKGVKPKYYNRYSIRIREITTAIELLKESNELKHCVFSYIDKCTSGSSSIWQMQEKKNDSYRSIVTIEVREGKVIQAFGQDNRSLEPEEKVVLYTWASEVGFVIPDPREY